MELKPKRFLILDDQLVLRKLISRQASFFNRFAVDIDEFSDPAEAMRSIAEGGYHLVITDIGMPGMNGIDFIKNVARLGYQGALLIISGYDDKTLQTIADMSANLGIACTRFLSKPYSAEAFVATLNNIFNALERGGPQAGVDIEALLDDICNDNYRLEFAPVFSLADRRLRGFSLNALNVAGARYDFEHLLPLLAGRRMASAVALETVVERMAKLLLQIGERTALDECPMNIRIDEACLGADNVFDHCFALLQQYGVAADRIGFELADGLSRRSGALCFENVAKIKYLGFRLVADGFGAGSLTVSNLLKFPFDQVNVPVETLRWLRTLLGEDAGAFRLLRYFGLPQAAVCATGLNDEESVALAQALGCPHGVGEHLAPAVPEQELVEMTADSLGGKSGAGAAVE
ncbi:EAL domain-containing response regulator [Chromobacterium vaccinii]|uniref:EAL domain-containing response regulator n=1 Tax=Chromobacterium vaccinii TaxID=1108595 RepID=UPI003C736F49